MSLIACTLLSCQKEKERPSSQTNESEVEKTRVLQEVQAQVLVARQCPRDEQRAIKRIMDSAKRQSLAENAIYSYPRGGEIVTGASIRTAETIAKYWGNLAYGIKELSQDNETKTSEVQERLQNNLLLPLVLNEPSFYFGKEYSFYIILFYYSFYCFLT